MHFADKVVDFHQNLQPVWKLPKGFELIYPFDLDDTRSAFSTFYKQYFPDNRERHFLFGINPGRFGAGVTGIPFTDPKTLEENCGIVNPFNKRNELSSIFIYEIIEAMGGPAKFYKDFYITSICPLGFIKDGININYYDDKKLEAAVYPHIIDNIKRQIQFGARRDQAFSIGQGKNYHFFKKINKEHKFFDQIVPLPHPRWVLQYRRKRKQEYLDEYILKLTGATHAN